MQGGAAAVAGIRPAAHQAGDLETPQDPAEIAAVEAQHDAEALGGQAVLLRQLEQHPALAEGEGAAEVALVQDADPAGVEAIEGADDGDVFSHRGCGHGRLLPGSLSQQLA